MIDTVGSPGGSGDKVDKAQHICKVCDKTFTRMQSLKVIFHSNLWDIFNRSLSNGVIHKWGHAIVVNFWSSSSIVIIFDTVASNSLGLSQDNVTEVYIVYSLVDIGVPVILINAIFYSKRKYPIAL
jgi:hypothetical protein